MQLTNNLAACTLTTQEPSLTIWQIFPKASSTKRISSLEEGIGTMLTQRNQFVDCIPYWMASIRNNYADLLWMCNRYQEPKLHCISAFSSGISHLYTPVSQQLLLRPTSTKLSGSGWLPGQYLRTVHAGRTFQGKVDWGPKSAELQHCALARNHLPTACRPESTFIVQYTSNISTWAVTHCPQCNQNPYHKTGQMKNQAEPSVPCYSLVFPGLIRQTSRNQVHQAHAVKAQNCLHYAGRMKCESAIQVMWYSLQLHSLTDTTNTGFMDTLQWTRL